MPDSLSPRSTLIKGAVWTVLTRWSIKGIGFLNTVVMARVLVPEDYGLVALATLVVSALQAFVDVGAATALLRKAEVERDEIDSAWTLRLLQCAVTSLVILALSPLAAMFFTEPRLQPLLWAFAAGMLLTGFGNIGPTLALKNYQFTVDFKINVYSKLVSVAATLGSAWWLGDYRALVIGILSGQVSNVLLSYVLHRYRPRWCTSGIAEIWLVTKWLMLANMGTFVLRKGDEIVAGRIASTSDYGLYNVGADLGSMPVQEIGPAMLRALLPVLASIKEDTTRLHGALVKILASVNGLIWGLSATFAVVAPDLTVLILGDKWHAAAVYVAWFAVIASAQTACMPLRSFLTLLGETRSQSSSVWAEFAVFVVSALALVPTAGLMGLVYARLIASVSNGCHLVWLVARDGGVAPRGLVIAVLRPVLSFAVALTVGSWTASHIDAQVARLLAGAVLTVLVYAGVSTLSWWSIGRPEGIESMAGEQLQKVVRR
jgi:O-antigen/teichoic acid export membrane protein